MVKSRLSSLLVMEVVGSLWMTVEDDCVRTK